MGFASIHTSLALSGFRVTNQVIRSHTLQLHLRVRCRHHELMLASNILRLHIQRF